MTSRLSHSILSTLVTLLLLSPVSSSPFTNIDNVLPLLQDNLNERDIATVDAKIGEETLVERNPQYDQSGKLIVRGLYDNYGKREQEGVLNARDEYLEFGTILSVPGYSPKPPTGLGLTGILGNTPSTISTIKSEPVARSAKCNGDNSAIVSCLGGEYGGVNKGSFLPASGVLKSSHVDQGAWGTCGFGAAIKSLILTGYQGNLQNKFSQVPRFTTAGWENVVMFVASLYRPGKKLTHVFLDDGLPKPCTGDYFSFRPSADNVFFVPLLEKAFAKFGDAFPEFLHPPSARQSGFQEEIYGYNGIEGISGGLVIRALIGGVYKGKNRLDSKGNIYSGFIDHFKNCVDKNIPCVAATPRTIQADGTISLKDYPLERKNLDPSNPNLGGQKAKLTKNWTIQNIPVIPTNSPGAYFKVSTGFHYYAISRSTIPGYITVSNPWGVGLDSKGKQIGDGASDIPVDLAAAMFASIEWVESG